MSILRKIEIAAALALFACPVFGQPPITLNDVTEESGVTFVHTDGSDGKHLMLESMTGGVAIFDYDLDGYQDIYFLNGRPLDREPSGTSPRNALYRNLGNWKFVDVSEQAGVADAGFGLGVAAADYNNDGAPDLFVNNFGENVLYRNNGDGTFSDVSRSANISNGYRAGGGVSFLDTDLDGDLDLYVANYIKFDVAAQKVHMHKGVPAYPSPLRFDPDPDTLLENLGDGTFADRSESSGIDAFAGRSMGVVSFDYDQDGDFDVIVANDSQANFLFENLGDNRFEEVGLLSGLAYDFRGNSQASMGIEVGDFNNDGLFDLYMTSLTNEYSTHYRNLGGGLFEDATRLTNAGTSTYAHVTWGVVGEDLNLDGQRDLFVAAGHLDDNLDLRGGSSKATGFAVRNIALLNCGDDRFQQATPDWGTAANDVNSSRGLASGDLDNDGDIDLVVLNSRTRPTLIRNDSPRKERTSVGIRLVGTVCNRDAIGAVVRVEQEGHVQFDLVVSGSGYQSDGSKTLYFGIDAMAEPAIAAVRWPGAEEMQKGITLRSGKVVTVVQPDPTSLGTVQKR